MELGCLFPPALATPAHIARAEELGYRRALVYDSPAFLADPWLTLGRAAALTSRIRLGVAATTPRLRHVVATAGALATLNALAPGRVEAVIGAGFTSQLMIGRKPARWQEVEAYTRALLALLAGEETEWDGAVIGLKHGAATGISLPAPVGIRLAAHGPLGYGVAQRLGLGIVTNLSHRGGHPAPPEPGRVQVLCYGTVLLPGERLDSDRVLAAAGPYAAFQLHLGDGGLAAATRERAGFDRAAAAVADRRRHLEVHRGHLIELTGLERPFVTPSLIARTTGTGTPAEVGAWVAEIAASGAEGVLYGPMGPDIPRELASFADAARATGS